MERRDRVALDRYITGNYGEDSVREEGFYSYQFVPDNKGISPTQDNDMYFDEMEADLCIDEWLNSLAEVQAYPAGTYGTVRIYDGRHKVYQKEVII